MDLYLGDLSPIQIAEETVRQLREARRLSVEPYQAWLKECGGYGVITFPQDDSQWVLRMGAEQSRHVHVHPARWAPATRRVRANVLKTALLVSAYVEMYSGDPYQVKLVNHVRQKYLDLSPMREVAKDQGLRPVIEVLRGEQATV